MHTRHSALGTAAFVVAALLAACTGSAPSPAASDGAATPAATTLATVDASSTPTPTTTTPTTPAAIVDPETGQIEPGTYVAHPFSPPHDEMSFKFDVTSDSWEALNDETGVIGILRFGDSGGLGMGFQRISSLNSDPCNAISKADDVAIGPTVDDLVAGLHASTEYETSDATDVSLGGYAGKQLTVTMPTLEGGEDWAKDCHDESFVIWNPDGLGYNLSAFGPQNRWTLWILDVGGERVVIRTSDFEDSPADLRQELESIVGSIEISAS